MKDGLFEAVIIELRCRKADPPAGKVVNGETYEWCAFHLDGAGKPPHSPSLRLNRDKRAWSCDACNEGGTLTELAERLGLEVDRHRDDGVIVTYDYCDADGNLWGQVCRRASKEFPVRRPDGHGGWIWNWQGVTRTLYRLFQLLATDPGEWVFVVEGEKDADRLASLGLVATTNPGGAGRWREEYSDMLRGRRVVVIPDNDNAGRRHSKEVARSLDGKAAEVRIVELPAEEEGDDVSEWLDRGGTKEELLDKKVEAAETLSSSASPLGIAGDDNHSLEPIRAEEFIRQSGEDEAGEGYLLEGMIPTGTVTLLVSHPKVGKSRLARQLCSAMETGGELCGKKVAQGISLYLALEENRRDVKRHLRQLGAKDTLVIAEPLRMTEQTIDLLKKWIRQYDLKLIVIDTLNRFWGVESSSDRRQTDAALMPLVVSLTRWA